MSNRTLKAAFAAVVLLLASGSAHADSWSFDKELKQDRYVFGDVEIVRSRDSRDNQNYPDFSVEIRRNGKSMALYRGVWFEEVFADARNETFVGLSNDGLPGTAVVVFTASGSLLQMQRHGDLVPEYCAQSVTRVRHWFDREQPEVIFEYETFSFGTYLRDIQVRLCNGKRAGMREVRADSARRLLEAWAGFEKKEAERPARVQRCAVARTAGERVSECEYEATVHTVAATRGEAGKAKKDD